MHQQLTEFKRTEKYASVLALVLMNILPNFIQVPLAIQIFVNACACLVLGCIVGVRFRERSGEVEVDKNNQQEKIASKDAYMFPVYGSCTLFGLYLLIKFINKDLIGYLFQAYFSLIGMVCLMQIIQNLLPANLQTYKTKMLIQKKVSFNIVKLIEFDFEFSQMDVITAMIALVPTYFYLVTNHWNLNNLFGISFSVTGIDSLSLPNFKVGFILLWGLFFYDIFWVYGTDVMLTVAKNLNAPIKLLFPIDLAAVPPKLSLLGLGDIVIPGVFVALCLKYDVDKYLAQKLKKLETPYFNACVIGYALGIVVTYCTMIFMNSGQPALLFLVPGCCGAVGITAFLKGEVKQVFEYEESKKETEDNKNKVQ